MREGNRTKLVLWGIFIVLAGYLSLKGLSFDKETFVWMGINLEEQAVEVYLPSILESDGKDASLSANILSDADDAPQKVAQVVKEQLETTLEGLTVNLTVEPKKQRVQDLSFAE